MANLRLIDQHNQYCFLNDPPSQHSEFRSMVVGLNTSRIAHAIREAPTIHIDLIRDFWSTATINRNGAGGQGTIEATIQNQQVIISEAVIREVLLFGDAAHHPFLYPKGEVSAILRRMGYEA